MASEQEDQQSLRKTDRGQETSSKASSTPPTVKSNPFTTFFDGCQQLNRREEEVHQKVSKGMDEVLTGLEQGKTFTVIPTILRALR